MKKIISPLAALFLSISLFAQNMQVKHANFTSFSADKKKVTPLLERKSSPAAKLHPEYGVLPYNAQCSECIELIDMRTENSRRFIDPKKEGHFYSQQSFFPLHYQKSENDIWRTIDSRLRPDAGTAGVYTATDQPIPTKCDLNKKSTSIDLGAFEFEFNKNLSMYFFDDNTVYTQTQNGNYANYTIGEEGLRVNNIWQGMDMIQKFSAGKIETNYVINAPLNLPITKGWMVIEDHFTLPAGYKFEEALEGTHNEKGYFEGNYELKTEAGEVLAVYEKAIFLDAKAWGLRGNYKLLRDANNNYTLQILVPIDWLSNKENTYPLLIDPIVEGVTKIGNFRHSGGLTANLAYTTVALGYCRYDMNVTVPGGCILTNAYVDLEYELTYDNTCGNPHEQAPYCTFSQVYMTVINNLCSTSTGILACNPVQPPYTGTCTTDSALVPGARSIWINPIVPDFLSCISPQCANYSIPFELQNQDSTCGDVCGYLCARGNLWQMTVEGIQGGVSGVLPDTTVCAGQPVVLTALLDSSMGANEYLWSMDGLNYDTVIGTNTYTVHPQQTTIYSCKIIDSCGNSSNPDTVTVTVARPAISVSGDTLTASAGANYQWYLNDTAITGATSQNYVPTVAGNYSVSEGGVTCNSAQVYFNPLGIKNITGDSRITILPNPSNGNFILRFNADESANNALLRITDEAGRIVVSKNIFITTGINTYTFNNQATFTNGIYSLEIEAAGKVFGRKIVVGK